MSLVELDSVNDLKDGQMEMVEFDHHEYMLVRIGDDFYCSDNRCPHMGGNLSKGSLNETILTCPLHHSQFDLKDGHNIRWTDWSGLKLKFAKLFKSPRPLKMYQVKIEGEKVMVEI